jgi:hypothetical protein
MSTDGGAGNQEEISRELTGAGDNCSICGLVEWRLWKGDGMDGWRVFVDVGPSVVNVVIKTTVFVAGIAVYLLACGSSRTKDACAMVTTNGVELICVE